MAQKKITVVEPVSILTNELGENPKWGKEEYLSALVKLFVLAMVYRKSGPQEIEKHIENPKDSSILGIKSPSIVSTTPRVLDFLCDTFKITLSADITEHGIKELIDPDLSLEPDGEVKQLLILVRTALVWVQKGAPPLVCIEAARRTLPLSVRPSFDEMDESTKEAKKNA